MRLLLPVLGCLPGKLHIDGRSGRDRTAAVTPRWFRINFARCIYCGLCEEACPTSAIQLTPDYEFSKKRVMDFVYEKEDLLVDHQGKDTAYNYYKYAGIAVGEGGKGEHIDEE